MGFMTLAQFETEVESVLGGRANVTSRLDTWINLAYFDVCGAVDFPELDTIYNFSTQVGVNSYNLPSGGIQIITLYDNVSKRPLRKVERMEVFRQDLTESGAPRIWARHGSKVYIHPTPSDVRSIDMLLMKEPVPLAASGDVTVLPRTWDAAILLLATSYGLLALIEENKSTNWYNRGLVYIQSRLIEGQTQMPSAQGG